MESAAIPATKRPHRWLIAVLLVLPYFGLCFPSLYARATPAIVGVPFFYWYQTAWIVLTSALLGIVYHLTKSR